MQRKDDKQKLLEKNEFKLRKGQIDELTKILKKNDGIAPELYEKYDVKRGLRDKNGRGVLTGLTDIAEVKSYTIDDNEIVPCEGKLYYRGYDVQELVGGFIREKRYGFEETTYLLLFGELPNKEELKEFKELLSYFRSLPTNFVRDVVMKAPSKDMMNTIARSVLTLYSYDKKADDISLNNVLRQSLQFISEIPMLAVYGYHAYQHYEKGESLVIHPPKPELSQAEHILYLLRPDGKYSKLEATTLDLAMVVHADHGGGNNSTFTTRVVTSTGTDSYSAVSAGLAALKGPRHGGANIKVVEMMNSVKENVKDWEDDEEIENYLKKIIKKKAFDKRGLIYGVGHAVYTISDPREVVLKKFVEKLSVEKGMEKEFNLYQKVEKLAPSVIAEAHKSDAETISPNVDFYSGFIYKMMDIPDELYTPLFACGRISGWCAHRLEELAGGGKIIRPAYKTIVSHQKYVPVKDR